MIDRPQTTPPGARAATAFGLALALAACAPTGESFRPSAPRGPAAPSFQATADTFLQITAAGAGPIGAAMPFDSKAILAQFPGYTTGHVTIGLETSTPDALVLFKDAYGGRIQVLHILGQGNRITQIHGVTHHVVGPAGERPGMSFAEARTDPATCRIGTNLWLGMAICRSRGAPNVTLTYSFQGEAAMATSLPPREILDTGMLQRIIWTPPG
ncbi:DUF1131 family protein [Siculibacillus lacustris]|uniref:DUF1131 family protein n=1 Tax=Siculibacillus lacustris TaxID=1549641 RepID=A0A4V2KUD3_9HYPH|nr:DUF1131 family protein [Siculibacillus lacustris]TBW41026.1 DUF1131 family protein [Siculibacillus lacustris]